MKKLNIKFIGILLLTVLALGSCKKWIDTSVNTNPDSPPDVPMFTLLATIEANMGYTTVGGTDVDMVTAIWVQQLHGDFRQGLAEGTYIFRDLDVDNQWNTNYSTTMINIKTLMDKAKAAKHPYYLGIGEVLMAISIGVTTDMWGDVPYSDAFKGLNSLTPKFDSQKDVYTSIKGLLDDAINNQLNFPNYPDIPQQDMIYGGDMGLWLKAANALRARYTLHLSKVDANAWTEALPFLDKAFTSNSDDMQQPFGADVGQQNPFFQFMDQRTDAGMDSVFISTLIGRFDPRIAAYALKNKKGKYIGAGWSYNGEDVSLPGPAFASPDSPVEFITYVECLLIKAECENHAGQDHPAQVDLVAALQASMDKLGIPAAQSAPYVHAYDSATSAITGDVLKKEIFFQKWLSLVYQAETFNDWRRSDNIIGLTPNPNGVLPNIPRRFPYSVGEKTYNPDNTPKGVTISDRVWWDKAK